MKHYAPNHLLIKLTILYPLTKFEAPSQNNYCDIWITSFQWPNLQRAITCKNKITFLKISPGYLLTILYQLTKFEATSC